MVDLVREASPGTQEVVAARLLDNICNNNGVDKRSGTLTLRTGGSRKTVSIGKPKVQRQFSTEDLVRMKIHFNFTDNRTLELANALRVVLGKFAVESGLRNYLRDKNKALTDFFTMKIIPAVRKVKDKETFEQRPYIYCKDLQALIHVLLDCREINPEEQEILLGADDGQQSLKVSIFLKIIKFNNLPVILCKIRSVSLQILFEKSTKNKNVNSRRHKN